LSPITPLAPLIDDEALMDVLAPEVAMIGGLASEDEGAGIIESLRLAGPRPRDAEDDCVGLMKLGKSESAESASDFEWGRDGR
jgi:hypothetical protein